MPQSSDMAKSGGRAEGHLWVPEPRSWVLTGLSVSVDAIQLLSASCRELVRRLRIWLELRMT